MQSHDARFNADTDRRSAEIASPDRHGALPSSDAVARHGDGGLTLDQAEDIAARRLRELAIRLSDGEGSGYDADRRSDAPPFDADRHFRARLAKRIADLSQGGQPDADPNEAGASATGEYDLPGSSLPYRVTDALDLSAFGERFAMLARSESREVLDRHPRAQPEQMAQDAGADVPDRGWSAREPTLDTGITTMALPIASGDAVGPVRLVDLIQEQRTLLDRLADLSLSQDAGLSDRPQPTPQLRLVEMVQTIDAPPIDTGQAAAANLALEVASNNAHPVRLSAEQLIAALTETVPLQPEEPEPMLSELRFRETSIPTEGHRSLPLELAPTPNDALSDPDRPPMIIERARAEMTALEAGHANHASPPSGAFGFIAGLSLSMMIGAVLYMYMMLQV